METERLVLRRVRPEDDAHDLGYTLRRDCWGRGYAREAASALIGCARAAGLAFLTATHDELNPASGAVMRARAHVSLLVPGALAAQELRGHVQDASG